MNLTTIIISLLLYGFSGYLYLRARHKGQIAGDSLWSPVVRCTVAPVYDSLDIGYEVALDPTMTQGNTRLIAPDGSYIFNLAPDYFANHPLYQALSGSVQDNKGNVFCNVPPVYWKFEELENKSKTRYHFSLNLKDGYELYPAFILSPNGFLFGKYRNASATIPNSVPGQKMVMTIAASAMDNVLNLALNTGGETKYHWATCWEESLIEHLCIMEAGTTNVSFKFGPGAQMTSGLNTDDATLSKWRGIYAMWGNIRTPVTYAGAKMNPSFTLFLRPPENPLSGAWVQVPITPSEWGTYTNLLATNKILSGRDPTFGLELGALRIPMNAKVASPGPYAISADAGADVWIAVNGTRDVINQNMGGNLKGNLNETVYPAGRIAKSL